MQLTHGLTTSNFKMIVARNINERSLLFRLFKLITIVINFGVVVFACRSYSKSQLIYKICAGLWIFQVTFVLLYTLLYDVQRDDLSMGGLIIFFNHISQLIAHLAILLESYRMDAKRSEFGSRFAEFEKRFLNELDTKVDDNEYRQNKRQGWINVILCFSLLIVTAIHYIGAFMTYQTGMVDFLIYWHSVPSALALQFRILEVLVDITALNEYATLLRCQLNEMGERNICKVFGSNSKGDNTMLKGDIIWVKPHFIPTDNFGAQSNEEADEERKLSFCKRFYGDIYNMVKMTNDHFGWSLFAFIIKYYINFLINSYWLVWSLVVSSKRFPSLLTNLGFLVISVKFMWILCLQTQTSQQQSLQIRSILFKIVKPAGKRSYKDLLTDFSLQTLHQQYTVTAKEFFNLNLNLLGSMAASIVTYLVILIQFMLAEKAKADHANTNSTEIYVQFLKN